MRRVLQKKLKRTKRKMAIRKTLSGTASRPRISVYRSNKFIYAQAIDDVNEVTLAYASDVKSTAKSNKVDKALEVGKNLGAALKAKKIEAVVFDRNGYKFHGRIKSIAEGIKEAGVKI
jgi:large subunit ribosomal protein L18